MIIIFLYQTISFWCVKEKFQGDVSFTYTKHVFIDSYAIILRCNFSLSDSLLLNFDGGRSHFSLLSWRSLNPAIAGLLRLSECACWSAPFFPMQQNQVFSQQYPFSQKVYTITHITFLRR